MRMNVRLPGLALATTLLCTACAGLGEYKVPAVAVAGTYGDHAATRSATLAGPDRQRAAHAGDIADDPWWQGFGDERLDRFVARVLAVNRDLANAALSLRNARLSAGMADDNPAMTFDIGSTGRYSRPFDGGASATTSRSARAGVSIGYEVDLWQRLANQRDAAGWRADASAEDLESTALSLAAEACRQYWALALVNQRIDAGEQSLEYANRTLALVRSQFAAGAVSRLEVSDAEQSLESQRAAQSGLLRERDRIRNTMRLLLDGQDWPRDDEPQDLMQAAIPGIRPGVPAQLLRRRPDLRAAELRLRASFADTRASLADYYPRLQLTGRLDGGGSSLADFLGNPVGSLLASLALPLLDLKQARLHNAVSRNDYAIAVNDFVSTLHEALVEVDDALSARHNLERQLEASRRSYEAALEAERLNEIRYRVGAQPLRTWLDAQDRRRQAEIDLARGRADQLRNLVSLYLALGGCDRAQREPGGDAGA